ALQIAVDFVVRHRGKQNLAARTYVKGLSEPLRNILPPRAETCCLHEIHSVVAPPYREHRGFVRQITDLLHNGLRSFDERILAAMRMGKFKRPHTDDPLLASSDRFEEPSPLQFAQRRKGCRAVDPRMIDDVVQSYRPVFGVKQ